MDEGTLGEVTDLTVVDVPSLKVEMPSGVFAKVQNCQLENASRLEEIPELCAMQAESERVRKEEQSRAARQERLEKGVVQENGDLALLPPSTRVVQVNPFKDVSRNVSFSSLRMVEEIVITASSFEFGKSLAICDLESLKSVVIQENCFISHGSAGSLTIQRCRALASITIQQNCFSFFRKCALKSLPSLQTVSIGNNCFPTASFVVKDADALTAIHLGSGAFASFSSCVLADLPALRTLDVGSDALQGAASCTCRASLKRLPQLNQLPNQDVFRNARVTTHRVAFLSHKAADKREEDRRFKALWKHVAVFVLIFCLLASFVTAVVGGTVFLKSYNRVKTTVIRSQDDVDALGKWAKWVNSIVVPDGSFPSANFTALGIHRFQRLRELHVGDSCFGAADGMELSALKTLKVVTIGAKSFSRSAGAVQIQNCNALTSVSIADNCFSAVPSFGLEGLPKLATLTIGSNCFCSVREWVVADLPGLTILSVGSNSFGQSNSNRVVVKTSNRSDLEVIPGASQESQSQQSQESQERQERQSQQSFLLKNCKAIKSVTIGTKSFSTFQQVLLENNQSLQTFSVDSDSFPQATVFRFSGLNGLISLSVADRAFAQAGGEMVLDALKSFTTLRIGAGCFRNINAVKLVGLKNLHTASFGSNAFSRAMGVFSATDCPALTSLTMGTQSFEHFTTLELRNLPSLTALSVTAQCFRDGKQFVLDSLKALTSLSVGTECFSQNRGELRINYCPSLASFAPSPNSFSLFTTLSLDGVSSLESIAIPPNSFVGVSSFSLQQMGRLRSLTIGSSSFSQATGSFQLTDCQHLASISIGDGAFASFRSLVLNGLPSLTTFRIGSSCFKKVSELKLESLSTLRSFTAGSNSFTDAAGSLLVHACQSLTTLSFAENSFSLFTSFVAQNAKLSSLAFNSSCFQGLRTLTLEGLTALQSLSWGGNTFPQWGSLLIKDCDALTALQVPAGVFANFVSLHVENAPLLKTLSVGAGCFKPATTVKLARLAALTSLSFGEDSFSQGVGSFVLEDCGALPSLAFPSTAFLKFTSLELNNLASLSSLSIHPKCFAAAHTVNLIGLRKLPTLSLSQGQFSLATGWLTLRDCVALTTLSFPDQAFANFNGLVFEGLPALRTLSFGTGCFQRLSGLSLNGLNSLKEVFFAAGVFSAMQGDVSVQVCDALQTLTVSAGAFSNARSFTVGTLPSLSTLTVGSDSFKKASLRLVNLPALKSVDIQSSAFSTAQGSLVVQRCPALSGLTVGNSAFSFSDLTLDTVPALKTLTFGNNVFQRASTVSLVNLTSLETVTVGNNSFSAANGQFSLRNCQKMKTLMIGDRSFPSFQTFEVKEVPLLQSLSIGSDCFKSSQLFKLEALYSLASVSVGGGSFTQSGGFFYVDDCTALKTVALGDDAFTGYISFQLLGLSRLERVEIGGKGFANAVHIEFSSLSSLNSVSLQVGAMKGQVDNCVLIMDHLTSLKTFTAAGENFIYPLTATFTDIPAVQTVNWASGLDSTEAVLNNVAKPLADRVCSLSKSVEFSSLTQLQKIPSTTRGIVIKSNTCNDHAASWLSFSGFSRLTTLRVGDNCMLNVAELVITNAPALKSVVVGRNSFTEVKGTWPKNRNVNRKFVLSNCQAVETLDIGAGSFADYGVCTITAVPSLKSISIGSLYGSYESYNFFYAKLELQRLPSLTTLSLGTSAFRDTDVALFEDMPLLRTMEFGYSALCFGEYSGSTLTMINLPALQSMTTVVGTWQDSCTYFRPHYITFYNLPRLTTVVLTKKAFKYKNHKNVNNAGALQPYFT